MDDIIIFSDSWEEHLEKVEAGRYHSQAFKMLLGCSIPLLPRTCNRKGKGSVPECKVKSLREFVKPVTKKDPQSFLGTTRTTGNSYETIPRELIASRKPLRRPLP